MTQHSPFYIDDLPKLRAKLNRAQGQNSVLGQVWRSVQNRAEASPDGFSWFLPFIALVTGEERHIAAARNAIRRYTKAIEPSPFGMGLQFHFWCQSFPHLKWTLYFQWLESIGAWEPDEAESLREGFITFQYLYFLSGMRTKPDPECVDNQTLSLSLSNALIGYLYGREPFNYELARRMYREGSRRLPDLLGGVPHSGYSLEGSTYMDYVVGSALPFTVEFLERTEGGDWFNPSLPPHGTSGAAMARMVAREWMPGGLLLPWDHYGYSLPSRACVAYAAHRTGDPQYTALLEEHANWAHDINVGWCTDDLIWTLIWWPDSAEEAAAEVRAPAFTSWAEPEVGGALVSKAADLYLMQMWDETEPLTPTRPHVNPNAVIFNAYGVPLSVDGTPKSDCKAFKFADAWREVKGVDYDPVRYNYGYGCAGAHSVLTIDGKVGMRALTHYQQADLVEFDASVPTITGDVTPIYQENIPDTRAIRRRSRLVADRFWLVEDLAVFEGEHDVAARWFLRPELVESPSGVAIETAEGVRLHLVPILGSSAFSTEHIAGFPDRLDGSSLQVEFTAHGDVVRWLWLAFPEATRRKHEEIADGWRVTPQTGEDWGFAEANAALAVSELVLPFTAPAFHLAAQPALPRWWYQREVDVPEGEWWITLPIQMLEPRVFVDGVEQDLSGFFPRAEIIEPHMPMPGGLQVGSRVTVTVAVSTNVTQRVDSATGFWGRPAVMTRREAPGLGAATYENGEVVVTSGTEQWRAAHTLMEI